MSENVLLVSDAALSSSMAHVLSISACVIERILSIAS